MPDVTDDPLSALLQPQRLTAVVDVGANPIDSEPPYKRMLQRGLCTVVGFEPQAPALTRLQQARGPRELYLPYALGDGGTHTLQVCNSQGMTSLKVPDPARLALFNLFPIWGTVTEQIPLTTRKLDDVAEVTALDFLKMDIQGSELDVLRHGRQKLAGAVAVQTEVSFITLYEGQPSFGEMDVALRELGFIPHCFAEMKIWPLSPTVLGNDPCRGLRQLVEADLVYVRDFTKASNMTGEQWKHLALIAHHCYQSVDLATRAVMMAAELGAVPSDAAQRYVTSLSNRKPN